ncbi:MAG: tetratricopeptide repeat protein, partial [Nannocystaceae bacterium]
GVKTAPRKQEEPKPETTEGTDTDVVDTDDVVEEAPETSSGGSGGGSRKGGQHDPIKRNKRDPAQSQQLANDAAAAAKAGKRGEAESLFHQALSFDNNNAAALSGLSDIYFDTGKRQKAVTFAERAVKAAPKSKAYQLKLGDAYYNVLRYRDALAAYEKAKDLGSDAAEGRIQKVKAKIGGG